MIHKTGEAIDPPCNPDPPAKVRTLQRLAHRLFRNWHLGFRKERDRKLDDLFQENLSPLGRASRRLQMYKEFLTREVKKRISTYRGVAYKYNCPGMLSNTELDRLRNDIMTEVHNRQLILHAQDAQDFADNGTSPVAVNAALERVALELEPHILDVVVCKLEILRIIGEAAALDGNDEERRTTVESPPQQGRAHQPGTAAASRGTPQGASKAVHPKFPKRAKWLLTRLRERGWSKHDLARHRGPDRKTTQKILDGLAVREDVIEKVAIGLSAKRTKVSITDIPEK